MSYRIDWARSYDYQVKVTAANQVAYLVTGAGNA
jgi:hypothetical protein